jgi:hypothetical protein
MSIPPEELEEIVWQINKYKSAEDIKIMEQEIEDLQRMMKLRTFEGKMTIKWYKNDNGDVRPLTIDTENEKTLNIKLEQIKNDFLSKGENGEIPYSIQFKMSERK